MRPRLLLFTVLCLGVLAGMVWFAEQALRQAERSGSGEPVGVQAAEIDPDHVLTGVVPDPGNLNPFTTTSEVAWRYVLGFTHEPLMERDPATGGLVPALAELVSAEGLELRFRLLGGTFPGGRPVQPEDVLFTWEVASRLEGSLGTLGEGLDLVDSAEIVPGQGDAGGTLIVRLKELVPYGPRKVATHWLVVDRNGFLAALPPAPEGAPEDGVRAARLLAMEHSGIGTGAYRLATLPDGSGPWWRRGRDLWLEAVPAPEDRADGAGRRARFAGVHLRFDLGGTQTDVALRNGELDWYAAQDLPGLLAREPGIAARYRRVTYDAEYIGTHGVIWNTQRSAVADPRVRRALGMLFDREAIIESLLGGLGSPAATLFKPGNPAHDPDLEPLPFDPAAARALLLEAGVGLPLEVTIAAPVEMDVFRQILDLAADAAQAAGVRLIADVRPYAAILELHAQGECDGVLLYISGPAEVPFGWFHSSGVGGRNMSRIADPELDRLLEQCSRILDPGSNQEPFRAMARRIEELQPVAFLFHPEGDVLIHNRIQGVEPGPLGLDREAWYAVK